MCVRPCRAQTRAHTHHSSPYARFCHSCQAIGEILGKGGFGSVYRALNIENGVTVAVKRVSKNDLDDEKLQSIESEVKLLKRLKHQNIVLYIETIREPDGALNIILEFIENGSLSSILKRFGGRFPEPLVAIYTAQVLLGLSYLHAQGVVHRDIKVLLVGG
jgi:serine/threonine protein kinase